MAALIQESDRKQIAELFAPMTHDVTLLMFTQEHECRWCETARLIVEELATLSPRVKTDIRDLVVDAAMAERYGIDKIPAIAVLGERDFGIRFFGVPAGYEFTPLIEAIVDVGRGTTDLPAPVLAELAKVDAPVHLQVMVTPT
jgi:alkyl hydroperoxide reductase subunit AhpF